MNLTLFILLIVGIGGGAFLYGRLPASALSGLLEDWIDTDQRSRTRHKRNKGKKKMTKAQKHRADVRSRKKLAEKNKYRAISLVCGKNPCSAAKRVEGKRALVAQFPRIPLSTCDVTVCECTYEHHADRRAHRDRRDVVASLSNDNNTSFNDFKSRSGRDRRKNTSRDEELKNMDISFD